MDNFQIPNPEYIEREIFKALAPKALCLVCGDGVPLTYENRNVPQICDKCKAAVLMIRRNMEDDDTGKPILDLRRRVDNV